MTEAKVFELILGIKEIHVERVDWQDQRLHIWLFEDSCGANFPKVNFDLDGWPAAN